MPIEAAASAAYGVRTGACEIVRQKLVDEGFDVTEFVPKKTFEGEVDSTSDYVGVYDAIVYVANLSTKSNQTSVRIEWAQPMGANCPHYLASIPTIFVSLENPYHLIDILPASRRSSTPTTPTTTSWTRWSTSSSGARSSRARARWMRSAACGTPFRL